MVSDAQLDAAAALYRRLDDADVVARLRVADRILWVRTDRNGTIGLREDHGHRVAGEYDISFRQLAEYRAAAADCGIVPAEQLPPADHEREPIKPRWVGPDVGPV